MSNVTSKSLELQVRTQSALAEVADKMAARMRDQKGQTAAEYLGIVVVIAAIIGVLATTDIGNTIKNAINTAIGKVAAGNGK